MNRASHWGTDEVILDESATSLVTNPPADGATADYRRLPRPITVDEPPSDCQPITGRYGMGPPPVWDGSRHRPLCFARPGVVSGVSRRSPPTTTCSSSGCFTLVVVCEIGCGLGTAGQRCAAPWSNDPAPRCGHGCAPPIVLPRTVVPRLVRYEAR